MRVTIVLACITCGLLSNDVLKLCKQGLLVESSSPKFYTTRQMIEPLGLDAGVSWNFHYVRAVDKFDHRDFTGRCRGGAKSDIDYPLPHYVGRFEIQTTRCRYRVTFCVRFMCHFLL